ncbi:hypothetical protein JL720_8530 [Aureococcus anophagefferens]|nr:hypothetical protein JL720_8530 [Aureococcus anophagefferens]
MDELTRQIKGMEEDRHGGAMDKDEAIEEATAKLDDMIDELDLMIVDQGTVNAASCRWTRSSPGTASTGGCWSRPSSPGRAAGDEAREVRGAEGNEARVRNSSLCIAR